MLSHAYRLAALLAAAALLMTFFFGPLPTGVAGDEAKGKVEKHDDGEAPDKKHAAAHHEPTAIEHVVNTREWHLFTAPGLPHGFNLPFGISKFMVLELIAALLIIAIYVPLAKRLQSGEPPRGAFANFFEALLTFVRDNIAKPNLGEEVADRYVPFLWTLFLFILFNNLLGMMPFMGSATASVSVTVALALVVFFAIHGSAILAMGSAPAHGHGHGHGDHGHGHDHGHHGHDHHAEPVPLGKQIQVGSARYVQSLWPHIDVPFPMGYFIKPLVFAIEVVGILVRNMVLAVRLFANMFAGHMVLATILLFIYMARNAHPALWGAITVSSVLGIVALSLLELFVAFLQAFIFTFLTSLFMGMAINPQH